MDSESQNGAQKIKMGGKLSSFKNRDTLPTVFEHVIDADCSFKNRRTLPTVQEHTHKVAKRVSRASIPLMCDFRRFLTAYGPRVMDPTLDPTL